MREVWKLVFEVRGGFRDVSEKFQWVRRGFKTFQSVTGGFRSFKRVSGRFGISFRRFQSAIKDQGLIPVHSAYKSQAVVIRPISLFTIMLKH